MWETLFIAVAYDIVNETSYGMKCPQSVQSLKRYIYFILSVNKAVDANRFFLTYKWNVI